MVSTYVAGGQVVVEVRCARGVEAEAAADGGPIIGGGCEGLGARSSQGGGGGW